MTGICLVSSPFALAQDIGSWWMYYGLNRVNDNWSVWTEAQYRSHDNGANIEQLLLRTAINYHISKNSMLGLGYGYISSYEFETDFKNPTSEEGRIFEQYIHKHMLPHFLFEHRFRVEQRLLQGNYKNRLRYRLFLTVPLTKKYMEEKTFFLGIYNEIFLNTVDPIFDRNRFYAALGYQFDELVNLQLGMMNQKTQYLDKWYFQLALTWNTDFRQN